jgi:hypothetical protein
MIAQTTYVLAAYAVGLTGIGAMLAASFVSMRRAERRAEELRASRRR